MAMTFDCASPWGFRPPWQRGAQSSPKPIERSERLWSIYFRIRFIFLARIRNPPIPRDFLSSSKPRTCLQIISHVHLSTTPRKSLASPSGGFSPRGACLDAEKDTAATAAVLSPGRNAIGRARVIARPAEWPLLVIIQGFLAHDRW